MIFKFQINQKIKEILLLILTQDLLKIMLKIKILPITIMLVTGMIFQTPNRTHKVMKSIGYIILNKVKKQASNPIMNHLFQCLLSPQFLIKLKYNLASSLPLRIPLLFSHKIAEQAIINIMNILSLNLLLYLILQHPSLILSHKLTIIHNQLMDYLLLLLLLLIFPPINQQELLLLLTQTYSFYYLKKRNEVQSLIKKVLDVKQIILKIFFEVVYHLSQRLLNILIAHQTWNIINQQPKMGILQEQTKSTNKDNS